jgi:alanine racemase
LQSEFPLIWAEVDLNAIARNVRELGRAVKPAARLMVAVKANAYGHGSVEVARTALAHGADWLGVARFEEAVQLREAGIAAPILIFGYTPVRCTPELIRLHLTQSVYSLETARSLSEQTAGIGDRLKVHLKVDTGMGRLGILTDAHRPKLAGVAPADAAVREVLEMAALPGLHMEGVFTHFASADSAKKTYTEKQLALFTDFLGRLRRAGLSFEIRHAANSGGIIDMPHTHLDMVRAGISLYGLYPSDEVRKSSIPLTPALAWKARIVHLKQVPAGFHVSYGMTHRTAQPTTIATVPVGYGDGYSRLLSNRGVMLVGGRRASIVGRVCMDLTMIDVGHIPGVAVDDEVVMLGRQGEEAVTADEIAALVGTINYEVVTAISGRVPRIFI